MLPVLVKHNIGVLGMKPMGDGLILKSKTAERGRVPAVRPDACPTSVVITGCDSIAILQQALKVARNFSP